MEGVRCFASRPHAWCTEDVTDEGRWTESDVSDEPMGTKEKRWLEGPGSRRWLFKQARSSDGAIRGEDWSECLVHGLACLVGVPTACVAPACDSGRHRGVISLSFVGLNERLEHGNELMATAIKGYDATLTGENPKYTPENVRETLQQVQARPPEDAPIDFLRSMCGAVTLSLTLGWPGETGIMRTGASCVLRTLFGLLLRSITAVLWAFK